MGVARVKKGPTKRKPLTAAPSKRVLTYQSLNKQQDIVVFDKPSRPAWAAGRNGGGHEHFGGTVVAGIRQTEYQGRHIWIKTSYEISVDGVPFQGHALLDNDGRLYSHACPYRSFDSAVDLMRHLIDLYPDSFQHRGLTEEYPAEGITPQGEGAHSHAHHK